MFNVYTARLYLGEEVIMQTSGDSVTELYLWMLTSAQKVGGQHYSELHGDIVDNHSNEVVQTFGESVDK